jgi:phosphatidylserine/phosphatidylglycerophosphate/cardiolipin synthase-like enzyme
MDPQSLKRWFDNLKQRDPNLYQDLSARLADRMAKITPKAGLEGLECARPAPPLVHATLETIVREGRPALLVKNGKITREDTAVDDLSKEIVDRLMQAASVIEPIIPLVGRIDVANFAGGVDYLGTGWLIDTDVIVTNRHVANLIARWDGGTYRFVAGRFGDPLKVSIDYRHEKGLAGKDIADIERVIFIEPDERKADIAFLEVKRKSDGQVQDRIQLADTDAAVGADVAVVGYPARASADVIPDQAWMDRIYGGAYDVKRVAPGLMDEQSRGWATHDCTTLGGNSGSTVIDMKTGRAVALHFAGLYMIENYAVPASTIRGYLRDKPWLGMREASSSAATAPQDAKPAVTPSVQTPIRAPAGSVSIKIPLAISISLGQPVLATATASGTRAAEFADVDAASAAFARSYRADDILAVRSGYLIQQGRITAQECIAVSARPGQVETVSGRLPSSFGGYSVEVRPASLADQLARSTEALVAEAVTSVMYDDSARTGPDFSFDPIDEEMKVVCHVGPERSFEILKPFLEDSSEELISSMYQFYAEHIADAVQAALDKGVAMQIVLDPQTRDPQSGKTAPGDFERSDTFNKWATDSKFDRIFVPLGSNGLVANSYHIKVTVRDKSAFWLSSGNWTRTSQPLIAEADHDDAKKVGRSGNREWHLVIENKTLANRFRSHILADFDQCKTLGGKLEAVEEPAIMVDVPITALEAIELEAAPAKLLEPITIERRVRVKPLLTPDQHGSVYSEAVLDLIGSARKQLVFQNQYIDMSGASGGYLKKLVALLAKKSKELHDCRIILRSGMSGFLDNMQALKKLGMDVNKCVRRLPGVHTKGIIADGNRVLVGSQNWSSLGVSLNRDASLLFDDQDIAEYFLSAFDIDWNRATELSQLEAVAEEDAPRLAGGSTPPPGFKRMSLSEYLEG